MKLKKTIAAYLRKFEVDILKEDGTFSHKEKREEEIDQKEVEMHPLQEDKIRKHWAIHEIQIKIPPKPSQVDEYEWMIEHGPAYIKQKRLEWQAAHDAIQPELEEAHKLHQDANDAWNAHATLCHANGYDYDTYPGDARQTLKMPEGK